MAALTLHRPVDARLGAEAGSDRMPSPPLPTILLPAAGGVRLRAAFARPPSVAPRATVVLLTGRAEFLEKYAETIADLTASGFAVAALDWRGQGGSSRLVRGTRACGHVADYRHYLDDLDVLLEAAAREGLPAPRLMVATSMGGHIGLRHLAERPAGFRGAALIAPMIDINFGRLPPGLVRRMARLAVRLGQAERYAFGQGDPRPGRCRFAGNVLTGSPERYAAWQALQGRHPDLALGGVTFGWLDASLRSIGALAGHGWAEGIDLPVLILQAGAESVVSNRAQDVLVARLPRGRLVRLPAARHDLLWEAAPVRDRVIGEITGFLGVCLDPGGVDGRPLSAAAG